MSKRLQVRVEPLGAEGAAPREHDEIVLAPDDPKFRPSDAAWMMVGLANKHVWVRHATGRNPFVVVKAQLAENDPEAFSSLMSVAAAVGFKARVCADFLGCDQSAARHLRAFGEQPLAGA